MIGASTREEATCVYASPALLSTRPTQPAHPSTSASPRTTVSLWRKSEGENIDAGCHEDATCTPGNPGHHSCRCKPGFKGDGYSCVPDCPVACQNGGVCVEPGRCSCTSGYQVDIAGSPNLELPLMHCLNMSLSGRALSRRHQRVSFGPGSPSVRGRLTMCEQVKK